MRFRWGNKNKEIKQISKVIKVQVPKERLEPRLFESIYHVVNCCAMPKLF